MRPDPGSDSLLDFALEANAVNPPPFASEPAAMMHVVEIRDVDAAVRRTLAVETLIAVFVAGAIVGGLAVWMFFNR